MEGSVENCSGGVGTGRQVGDIIRQQEVGNSPSLAAHVAPQETTWRGHPQAGVGGMICLVCGREDGWIWWNQPDEQRNAQQSLVQRRRRESTDDLAKRAERAVALVQMGEVCQAREGAQPPWTLATFRGSHRPQVAPGLSPEKSCLEQFQNSSQGNSSCWMLESA